MPAERTKKVTTKVASEKKEKRPPSPYNLFFKEQLPIWKAHNPGASNKEAMSGIAALWADSELNPNRGKPKKAKKAKKTSPEDDSATGSSSAAPSSDF